MEISTRIGEDVKMSTCFLCKDELTASYFMRIEKVPQVKNGGMLVEVCPECHIHFMYDQEDDLKSYILRRDINMRGYKVG